MSLTNEFIPPRYGYDQVFSAGYWMYPLMFGSYNAHKGRTGLTVHELMTVFTDISELNVSLFLHLMWLTLLSYVDLVCNNIKVSRPFL
jgi:hypothetical protein